MVSSEQIMRAAEELFERHGSAALEQSRSRVERLQVERGAHKDLDVAFRVLSAVESILVEQGVNGGVRNRGDTDFVLQLRVMCGRLPFGKG